jgi:MarR-like DNA-binding transcriptional regulator SgrR of sgrS sRNA
VNELDFQASLAFPYPKWTRGLAHPGAGVIRTPRRMEKGAPIGSGPFSLSPGSTDAEARFTAFDDCSSGRPFVDGLRLLAGDARAAVRALDLKEADVAMFPLGDRDGTTGPGLVATYLVVNDTRLGDRTKLVRRIFGGLVDPADLARLFVRQPAVALRSLLPSELDRSEDSVHIPLPPGWKADPFMRLPASLTLITDGSSEDHRRVGERYQIKLRDAGVALEVKRMPRQALRSALLKGEYDAALITFPALPEPGLALAQVTYLAKGPDVAREQLRALGSDGPLPATADLWDPWYLPILPLYAQGLRAVVRPGVSRFGFDPSGAPSLADAWFHELPRERK